MIEKGISRTTSEGLVTSHNHTRNLEQALDPKSIDFSIIPDVRKYVCKALSSYCQYYFLFDLFTQKVRDEAKIPENANFVYHGSDVVLVNEEDLNG